MPERLILLTNDDGLESPGLALLASVATSFGRVVVVAPDRNRSAVSSALSLNGILRLEARAPDRHACDGTPVDCVLLGVRALLGRAPDWVLSGVNLGLNLGEDVFYSGTVGAAFEGCLQGARSAAFAMPLGADGDRLRPWLMRFLSRWESIPLSPNRIWNVNFPAGEPLGFRLTRQDNRHYHDSVERRMDPRGAPYYWIGGNAGPTYTLSPGSDAEATTDGWISLSPLRLDLTDPDLLAGGPGLADIFNGGCP